MRRLASWLLVALSACGEETPGRASRTTAPPGGSPGDAGSSPPGLAATVEIADGLGSEALLGDPLDLIALPSGTVAAVYAASPPGARRRVLRYAERVAEDDWRVEDIVEPGGAAPEQLEILSVSAGFWDGTVHVTYLGGDDDGQATTPFPTDLALASRGPSGTWTERLLVDTSGEAAGVCPDLQNYCNTGHVVGSHAALAVASSGAWAVLYRDTHFGFAKDDLERSDTEIVRSSGAATLVDAERGGGAWGRLAFLPSGRLAAAYLVEAELAGRDERGIWVAIEDETGGFDLVRVTELSTTHRIGLAAAPSGTLWLAFYEPGESDLVVARAEPPYTSWSLELVDELGFTGLHPDLTLGADGAPRVAFGFCGLASAAGCPGSPGAQAEVRLARRRMDGAWDLAVVDEGDGRGGVGFYNRLARLPDGRLAIATQDARNFDVRVAIVEEAPE